MIALGFIVFAPVYVTYFESSLPSSVINSVQSLVLKYCCVPHFYGPYSIKMLTFMGNLNE